MSNTARDSTARVPTNEGTQIKKEIVFEEKIAMLTMNFSNKLFRTTFIVSIKPHKTIVEIETNLINAQCILTVHSDYSFFTFIFLKIT